MSEELCTQRESYSKGYDDGYLQCLKDSNDKIYELVIIQQKRTNKKNELDGAVTKSYVDEAIKRSNNFIEKMLEEK